jgi:magnesium transporter
VARDETPWAARTASRARRARQALPLLVAARRRAANGDPAAPPAAGPADPPRPIDEVIGDCAVYEYGSRRPGRLPLEKAGSVARSTPGFVWIGLQQPTAADIAKVASEFNLPHLALEDAVKAHQRPKLDIYDDMLFVVLKPVRYVDHDEVVDVTEIAIFLGANFVVTVRHGESDVLHRVRAEVDAGSSKLLQHGPTGVLYRTADLVVDGYEEAIEFINEDVDEIETQVFGSPDAADHSERIYKLKREIAEFRRAVLPLAAPLQRLSEGTVPGIDPSAAPYFRDVHDHVLRAADAIEGHDRLLSDILQADLARVTARQSELAVRQTEISVRQNEDMRKISAWAAIALVPTAIAGIYGMNFHYMPELRWHYGYFMALGVMGGACFVLYRLFRRNGWL